MNIFANHLSAEELLPRIYKELSMLNRKNKTNYPTRKWTKRHKRYIKKNMQVANKHKKKLFNISSHEGNANENLSYHYYPPVRTAG